MAQLGLAHQYGVLGVAGSSPVTPTIDFELFTIINMKFYIASRVNNKSLVKNIRNQITKLGHQFLSTWIDETNIIPYEKNAKNAKLRAIQCIKDTSKCDVFILISDEEGAGMYTELGVALLAHSINKRPKIYVIGDHLNRSMFFFHSGIKRLKTFEEVLADLK